MSDTDPTNKPADSPKRDVVEIMAAMLEVDPTLVAKELGTRVNLSGARVARVFKQRTGMSIVEFRNRLRFKRFLEMLAEAHQPRSLRQAALAAGFGSYGHFHRLVHARWRSRPSAAFRNGWSAISGLE